jgi:hypothetical protein
MPNPIYFPAGGNNFAFLVSEAPGYQSREEGVVAAGAGVLKGGTVMFKANAGVTWAPWVSGNTDGVAGLLAEDTDASGSAAQKKTIFVRLLEAQRAELFFAGTPNATQRDAAYALLAVNHIIMR